VLSLAIISIVIVVGQVVYAFHAHGGQKGRGAKLTERHHVGTQLTNPRFGGRGRRCGILPEISKASVPH
jgi:hypothetical protein